MSEGVLVLEKRCIEERGGGENVLWWSPHLPVRGSWGMMRHEMAAVAHVPMVQMHLGFTMGMVNTAVFGSQLSRLQLWCPISQHHAYHVPSPVVYGYITVHLTTRICDLSK